LAQFAQAWRLQSATNKSAAVGDGSHRFAINSDIPANGITGLLAKTDQRFEPHLVLFTSTAS
jgi:hypothetical protein